MSVTLTRTGEHWTLHLTGVVGIREADLLHHAVSDAAREPRVVTVECEGLESLDTCATQLLLALQSSLAARDCALRLEHVPPAIAELWRHGGLRARLG